MIFGSLVFRTEVTQLAIFQDGKAITHNRRHYLAGNKVVRHQYILPIGFLIKDIHKVLAVGRSNTLLKHQVFQTALEYFILARLQVISVREYQSVIIRQ